MTAIDNIIAFSLIFIMLCIAFLCLLKLLNRSRGSTKRRMEEISKPSVGNVPAVQKHSLLSKEQFENSRLVSIHALSRFVETVSNEILSSGLTEDPIRLILVWMSLVILIPLVENVLGVRLIVTIITIILAAIGPLILIKVKKSKRTTKFHKQLSSAIEIICNALKAGYSFPIAMSTVAKEMEEPISEEFFIAFRETQFGLSLSDALKNMAKRTGSEFIELLEVAVSVQSSVGGNMVEILSNISNTITARFELQEEIKAKTASGRLAGILVGSLPVFLLIVINVINPEYSDVFLHTQFGHIILAAAALLEIAGFLIIRKILKVDY